MLDPETLAEALKMNLEKLGVNDAYYDARHLYIEFTDGEISIEVTEEEMRELPDAFSNTHVAWNEA